MLFEKSGAARSIPISSKTTLALDKNFDFFRGIIGVELARKTK
jgi:hypothetical protein